MIEAAYRVSIGIALTALLVLAWQALEPPASKLRLAPVPDVVAGNITVTSRSNFATSPLITYPDPPVYLLMGRPDAGWYRLECGGGHMEHHDAGRYLEVRCP